MPLFPISGGDIFGDSADLCFLLSPLILTVPSLGRSLGARMALRLRGEAWWLRKMMGGTVYDLPLGIYGGEKNRKRAETEAKRRARELKDGHTSKKLLGKLGLTPAAPKAAAPTLADWWKTYLDTYTPAKAANTQAHDRFAKVVYCGMQIGESTLGAMGLDEIKQADCLKVLQLRRALKAANPKRKTPTLVSEGTVQRDRRLLQAIFERAVENDHIAKNPWKGVDAKPGATRSHRLLTPEDEGKPLGAFSSAVKDAVGRMVSTHPRYTRFIRFMLETGLRIDELLNDQFKDNGAYIHVRGKFAKERDVVLTKKARKTLDEQWADMGDTQSPRPKGSRPWWQHESRFAQVMTKGCERAGILHLSPHDLRHTFGHRFLVKGVTSTCSPRSSATPVSG